MKLKITETGVFDAKGAEIPVGTIITAKGDDIPSWLAGKAELLGGDAPADAATVTNPAT